jgi:uncharacterized membrane protein
MFAINQITILLCALGTVLSAVTLPAGKECQDVKWKLLSHKKPFVMLSLDALYWSVRFQPKDDSVVLRFSGQLPRARYWSFTAYDKNNNVFKSIADQSLVRNPNNVTYDVYVVAENKVAEFRKMYGTNINVVMRESNPREKGFTIWMRAYIAKDEFKAAKVYAMNMNGTHAECPETRNFTSTVQVPRYLSKLRSQLPMPFARKSVKETGLVESFLLGAEYIYNNVQNGYLTMVFPRLGSGKVLVVSARAPKAAVDYDITKPSTWGAKADVRYYSVSLLIVRGVMPIETIHDSQFPKTVTSVNGTDIETITVVVVRQDYKTKEFIEYCEAHGIVPIFYRKGDIPRSLFYRQMEPSPDFPGNAKKYAKSCGDCRANPTEYLARTKIGSYAPLGRVCSVKAFLNGECKVDLQ